jgi:type IV secretion system protein VirD4
MPDTSGFLETTTSKSLKVDAKEVPFVVRTVLGQLGWGNFFFDFGLATADRKKQLKRAGLSRTLEHRIQVKWRENKNSNGDADGVYVRVQVDDGDGHARVEELKDSCLEVLKGIFERAEEVKAQGERERRTTYGSAKWAEQEDLRTAGYISSEDEGTRFVLGVTDKDEQVAISSEDTIRHAIVCGPTGSGKTSRIIIPQMIKRWRSSAIVTEATAGDEPPDVYQKTAGFRKAMGHKIYSFNPDVMTSHRINPIDQVKTVEDAQVLVNLIIENTNKKEGGGNEAQIWDNSERHLLTALLLHAAGLKSTLLDVRSWLSTGAEGMKFLLLKSPVEKAKTEYMAFYNISTENFRNGVISGVMMRLNLWVSPKIAALTATTDVDVAGLRKELFTFYLSVPAQKGHLKPLAVLAFNYLLSQTDKDFDRPLFLCLDEFTNFGRIPDFSGKISIIRHRKISALLGFQDYMQLEITYGRDPGKILWRQPATRVFFKPNDLETAKRISEELGIETYYERTISSSGQIQEKEFGRPLMNPGEILAMGDQRGLVFTPKTGPLKLKTYAWQQFVEEMAMPPPVREPLQVDERLIKTCEQAAQTPQWQAEWVKTDPPELKQIYETIENAAEIKVPPIDGGRVSPEVSDEIQERAEEKTPAKPAPEPDVEEEEIEEDPYGQGAII